MNQLWNHGCCSITQLVHALRDDTGWNKSTIHIMLSRLIDKGAVQVDNDTRPKMYYPILEQERAVVHETRSFLSRVYGGSIGSMMNCMVGNSEFTREEIDELYEILRKAEQKERGDQ